MFETLYNKKNIKVNKNNKTNDIILYVDDKIQLFYNEEKTLTEESFIEPIHIFENKQINVLNIGLGGGRTAIKLLDYKNLVKLDLIEKYSDMLNILKYFNSDKLINNKKINIIFQDAYEYVKNNKIKYDFIVIDVCQKSSETSKKLYTKEFFYNLLKNNFHGDTAGVFWYVSGSKYYKRTLKSYEFLNNLFKNVSYHTSPGYHNGNYIFFSNKYTWNKNII